MKLKLKVPDIYIRHDLMDVVFEVNRNCPHMTEISLGLVWQNVGLSRYKKLLINNTTRPHEKIS